MEFFLYFLLWWAVGFGVTLWAMRLYIDSLYNKPPHFIPAPPLSVGDGIFAAVLGLGGLITVAVAFIFALVECIGAAMDHLDKCDRPLFPQKDKK